MSAARTPCVRNLRKMGERFLFAPVLLEEEERQCARAAARIGASQHGQRSASRGIVDEPLFPRQSIAARFRSRAHFGGREVPAVCAFGERQRHRPPSGEDARGTPLQLRGARDPNGHRPEKALAKSDCERRVAP